MNNNISKSSLSFIKSKKNHEIHRAKWVMIDPDLILENAFIEIENGIILNVFSKNNFNGKTLLSYEKSIIDHGQILLMPVFINAHCHLELSAFHNSLPMGTGFAKWVKALIDKRSSMSHEQIFMAAKTQAEKLTSHGTGFMAEISSLGITRYLFENSTCAGVWFQEYLGSQTLNSQICKNNLSSFSLAGHAPHTTSPELLKKIKKLTNIKNLPFSIHLGESEEEKKFITGQRGSWKRFLDSRQIDTCSWPVGARSCVDYIDKLNLLDKNTLAVHLIHTDHKDLNLLYNTNTSICICPRSNFALHSLLPDIELMLNIGLTPALGTDSLGSCESLHMLDEMIFIRKQFPGISPSQIVKMSTKNGSKALGISTKTGTLEPGKLGWFLKIPLQADSKKQISERLLSHDWQ